jgi:hypothetical protein
MRIKITVYWDVTPCSLAPRHQVFVETWCVRLQDKLFHPKMETVGFSETLVTNKLHSVTS